ncbi:MAG: glycosyltransferase family protein [Nitrospirae bacterium]|nr:glycosyltransferase family protein [Nitrospirota bacterium]
MRNATAVIQARLGSTRLPGKTLMMIEGESLLGHLVHRIKASKYVNDIIIATTTKQADDEIVRFAEGNNLKFYRGSEQDVLDRFYKAAIEYKAETIVRVTPDCPMLDPEVMDLVILKFLEGDFDYAANILPPSYPDGLDTEVFSFKALEKAWKEAGLPSEREHVTQYIIDHPELFRLSNIIKAGEDLSWMRWTVDHQEDLDFAREIFRRLHKPGRIFYMNDILRLLEEEPGLLEMNKGFSRNEGYEISLLKDKKMLDSGDK